MHISDYIGNYTTSLPKNPIVGIFFLNTGRLTFGKTKLFADFGNNVVELATKNELPDSKYKIDFVTYTGTGQYGQNRPCTITSKHLINVIFFLGYCPNNSPGRFHNMTHTRADDVDTVSLYTYIMKKDTWIKDAGMGFGGYTKYGKVSSDLHSISWYNVNNASDQLNHSGSVYYFMLVLDTTA